MNTDTQHNTSREQVEVSKIVAEMLKLLDEREKLRAETAKMQGETRWHPLVVGAGIFSAGAVFLGAAVGALLGLVKLFVQ